MLQPQCEPQWLPPFLKWRSASGALLVLMLLACPSMQARAEPVASPGSLDDRFVPTALSDGKNAVLPDVDAVLKRSSDDLPKAQSPRVLDSRTSYRALIEKETAGRGLAPEIAEAVMAVESGYNPGAIGGVGEIGLMQILPSTARMLGFVGSNTDLAAPATNIRYGVMYLAQAWRLAGGDLCTAVMKYRAGHGESRFSYLSVNYCLAVRSKLMARGFRVTGTVPAATFGAPGGSGGGCRRKCLGGGGHVGTVNLAALNTRLTTLVMQVKATR